MPTDTVRALVDQVLSGGGIEGVADDRAREEAKAELTRLALELLDELTAPLAGEHWPDRSVSDLRSDVLVKFLKSLAEFRGATRADLRGWLRKILENTRKNYHRYADARRPANGSIQSLDGLLQRSPAHSRSEEPLATDMTVSKGVQLRSALERLSQKDRQIFELRFSQGLAIEDIAERVGCHERTVRRDIERIRATLRQQVEPPG